jgi:hypothetical protein
MDIAKMLVIMRARGDQDAGGVACVVDDTERSSDRDDTESTWWRANPKWF